MIMTYSIDNFLQQNPDSIEFKDTMALIDTHYEFVEIAFNNGNVSNAAGQNSGSCKILSFARRQGLSVDKTLALFGQYYREDVLQHPQGEDHQNIRQFMLHGWDGVEFYGEALTEK